MGQVDDLFMVYLSEASIIAFSMSKGLGKVIGRVSEASKITTVSTSTCVRGADCYKPR